MNDEIRELVSNGATKDRLVAAGKRNGMSTLRESGLRAIFEGFSTIDEIVRETILDDDA